VRFVFRSLSPPAPAPSPGRQRHRGPDGEWVNYCTDTSCPAEGWVTALYPAAQAAALQSTAAEGVDWPEVWGCSGASDCRFNGRCDPETAACVCDAAWRGPTCAALRLGAGLDEGLLQFSLSNLLYMENLYSYKKCRRRITARPRISTQAAPRDGGFQHENASSWGGSIMHDTDGLYHMFTSFISGGCGLDAW
jgi:hypothetical protein